MKKTLLAIVLSVALAMQIPMVTMAADTVFMVPEISSTWEPPGTLYKSPYLDFLAYKGSQGLVADIINNRGLVAALTDLNANVSPSKYNISILGVYPEGEILNDEVMQMIASAGWKKVEIYYPTFFLAGDPNCNGMTPVVEKTENADLNQLLTTAGYAEQVAVIKVEGVTFSDPIMILYEPDFSFLRGKNCTMYKYIPDIQKFVAGPYVLYDGYNRNFMDIENLTTADGEVNGTYVVATQPLPTELMITTEEIQPLRDKLETEKTQVSQTPQTSEDTQVPNDSETPVPDSGTQVSENAENQTGKNEVTVPDTDEQVKWSFANGVMPENFTAEAKVEVISDKEVKVDFAYTGKLPEGTTVTIRLPQEGTNYKEGATLYFYYYNPDTQGYEYVSEGVAGNEEVTFEIKHCSEYLITSEKMVVSEAVEKGNDLLLIVVAGVAVLLAAGIVIGVIIRKRRK